MYILCAYRHQSMPSALSDTQPDDCLPWHMAGRASEDSHVSSHWHFIPAVPGLHVHYCIQPYMDFEDLNSGPHTCMVNT